MTCIVGLKTEDGILLGGDRATVWGDHLRIQNEPKVYKKGDFIFGGAGWVSIIQLMPYTMVFPEFEEDLGETPTAYMVNKFIPQLQKVIDECGRLIVKDGKEECECDFIVGFKGHLFNIGADFSLFEPAEDYIAIGTGGDYAEASLYTSEDFGLPPKLRLELALESASKFNNGVAPPFDFEEI